MAVLFSSPKRCQQIETWSLIRQIHFVVYADTRHQIRHIKAGHNSLSYYQVN